MEKEKYLIIITHGMEDGLRQLIFGFHYALTLLNLGQEVTIYLTGLAVQPVLKDVGHTIQGHKIDSMKESVQEFLDAKGEILACITCIRENCEMKSHKSAQKCLIDGVKVAGLNVIGELSLSSKVVTI